MRRVLVELDIEEDKVAETLKRLSSELNFKSGVILPEGQDFSNRKILEELVQLHHSFTVAVSMSESEKATHQ